MGEEKTNNIIYYLPSSKLFIKPQGKFFMKSNSNAQKTASEIAQEIFKVTKVESSFDKKGRFLHLIAKL